MIRCIKNRIERKERHKACELLLMIMLSDNNAEVFQTASSTVARQALKIYVYEPNVQKISHITHKLLRLNTRSCYLTI